MHVYILNVQLDRVIFSCILDLLGRLIGNFLFDIVHKCTHFNWFTVKHKLICLLYKQRGKKELKKISSIGKVYSIFLALSGHFYCTFTE